MKKLLRFNLLFLPLLALTLGAVALIARQLLQANARGISDLGGNVWEWCADAFSKTSGWRTLRGGSWATSAAEQMLASFRRGVPPSFRHDDIGFRCVIATDDGSR